MKELVARIILFPLLVVTAGAPSWAAPDWKFRSIPGGRCEARATSPGATPDGSSAETELRLVRSADGAVSVEYVVLNPDRVRGFTFDDFEGPYAPAAKRKLTLIRVKSSGRVLAMRTRVAGYYASPQGFAFSLSTSQLPRTLRRSLEKSLTSGMDEVTIIVYDSRQPRRMLRTTFRNEGDREAVRRVFLSC